MFRTLPNSQAIVFEIFILSLVCVYGVYTRIKICWSSSGISFAINSFLYYIEQ